MLCFYGGDFWKQEARSNIYPRYTTWDSFLTYDRKLFLILFLLQKFLFLQMKKILVYVLF